MLEHFSQHRGRLAILRGQAIELAQYDLYKGCRRSRRCIERNSTHSPDRDATGEDDAANPVLGSHTSPWSHTKPSDTLVFDDRDHCRVGAALGQQLGAAGGRRIRQEFAPVPLPPMNEAVAQWRCVQIARCCDVWFHPARGLHSSQNPASSFQHPSAQTHLRHRLHWLKKAFASSTALSPAVSCALRPAERWTWPPGLAPASIPPTISPAARSRFPVVLPFHGWNRDMYPLPHLSQ